MLKKINVCLFMALISFRDIYVLDMRYLCDVLQEHPKIKYIKCHEVEPFCFKELSIPYPNVFRPNKGFFSETFILKIPEGRVCSDFGWVEIDGVFIEDFLTQQYSSLWQIFRFKNEKKIYKNVKKVSGRVAVIARIRSECYGHWLVDVLSRLALLEMFNIDYDWLYVPMHLSFMKESLVAWGVDIRKIIEPIEGNEYIQADELIVPSLPFRRDFCKDDLVLDLFCMTCFCSKWYVDFLRNKILSLVKNELFISDFSKKIFISRKDASRRKIINEDEIYALFEERGFKRFNMSDYSFLEQVALFQQAEAIVAAHGSALANLIFCQPGAKIVEIFQNRPDSSFYYLAQLVDLNYKSIQTESNCFVGSLVHCGMDNTIVPASIIKNFLIQNQDL